MEFGFFKGLPHTDSSEDFSKYRQYKNSIPKAAVIAHMNSLDAWLTSEPSYELFTKEQIQAGVIEDGDFVLPYKFLHYYKNYDIGIPPDYEAYLKQIGVGAGLH